jgi:hypothetical protein
MGGAAMPLRLRSVSMSVLAFAALSCREGVTFLPVDPTTVRQRIVTQLDGHPNLQTRAVPSGATIEIAKSADTPCESGEVMRFMMDWTSEANHLTIAMYQTGESPSESSGSVAANCRVPGSSAAASPSLPVCPIVASATTAEKPKALEQAADRIAFSVVVTNHGPGNDTIRWVLTDIGRHTRLCARPGKLYDTAQDDRSAQLRRGTGSS